jgi:hypothetical protein
MMSQSVACLNGPVPLTGLLAPPLPKPFPSLNQIDGLWRWQAVPNTLAHFAIRWLSSAGRCPYEHYTSSHQQKRDREDNNVWHSALRFLRSRRLKYTPRRIAQQGE